MAKKKPSVQARSVLTGMLGSSVFATADLTSGYGESSSDIPHGQFISFIHHEDDLPRFI